MAVSGVLRPGHVQLRVFDLEESVRFYGGVLGLEETGRDRSGRVYFKAWDERDHNSFVLRQADEAGIDLFAFKVDSRPRWTSSIRICGPTGGHRAHPQRRDARDGERVRFEIPSGHLIELYAEKTEVGNGLGLVNPEAWPRATTGHRTIPHGPCAALRSDIEKVTALFTEVLVSTWWSTSCSKTT